MSATAASLHRDHAGRFTPRRTDWPACTECGSILAENLLGELRCLLPRCDHYRLAFQVPSFDGRAA